MLNDHNLDRFKNFLQEKYKHEYKEWKEKEFDINHLFSLEGREYRYQSTLLHVIVGDFDYLEKERKKLIRYLLDEGADVNALDSFRNTPLHESCYKEVIQILLDAGANPFIKDHHGRTARDCTCDKERKQLLKKAEDKYKYKAMKVGSVCGVVAALAVGGGLFAAGVALPILALIGIAVAAAVLTGLIAGGITYAVSTKIENPDTSRSATEQGLPQPN
ncbi:ankyrin repeat domain-containing protein [Wolbachia endosymbiont (group A) of Limnophora tigrina]|uniref:ankyrin repeat domain-containing protein n=1 Tax=Wolbachia endosymbiont (group A) of Limnophora tigrina TaxID=3139318 RepID=UPI0035B500D5